jgi:hypothetical protein
MLSVIGKYLIPDKWTTTDEPLHTFRKRLFKGLGFTVKMKPPKPEMLNITTFKGNVTSTLNFSWTSFQFEIAALFVLCFAFFVINLRRTRLQAFNPDTEQGKRALARLIIYKSYKSNSKLIEENEEIDSYIKDNHVAKEDKEDVQKIVQSYYKMMKLFDKQSNMRLYVGCNHFKKKSMNFLCMGLLIYLL